MGLGIRSSQSEMLVVGNLCNWLFLLAAHSLLELLFHHLQVDNVWVPVFQS